MKDKEDTVPLQLEMKKKNNKWKLWRKRVPKKRR